MAKKKAAKGNSDTIETNGFDSDEDGASEQIAQLADILTQYDELMEKVKKLRESDGMQFDDDDYVDEFMPSLLPKGGLAADWNVTSEEYHIELSGMNVQMARLHQKIADLHTEAADLHRIVAEEEDIWRVSGDDYDDDLDDDIDRDDPDKIPF